MIRVFSFSVRLNRRSNNSLFNFSGFSFSLTYPSPSFKINAFLPWTKTKTAIRWLFFFRQRHSFLHSLIFVEYWFFSLLILNEFFSSQNLGLVHWCLHTDVKIHVHYLLKANFNVLCFYDVVVNPSLSCTLLLDVHTLKKITSIHTLY